MMLRICAAILVTVFSVFRAGAQDIPMFSQKLTNFFIYNPSIAGHTHGSVTYAYRQNYANVAGTPQNHFLSIHTPFFGHRMGTGFNLYQEDVNFLRNTYLSAATAYHLHFNRYNILSLGASAEYNITRISGTSNTIGFEPDPVLGQLQNGSPVYDFSFGAHYQNRYFKAGLALNRLSTAWIKKETSNLTNYYSGYAQGLIPLRDGLDIIEPMVSFRRLSQTNQTLDLGLFYTYNNQVTAGASLRSGKVASGTMAYRFNKRLLVGYSREMILSGFGGFVGSANEITLRLDFNDESYQQRFRDDYKNAMTYRRKTMSSPASSRTSATSRNKKPSLKAYSPNARYQNNLRLATVKKKSRRGKDFWDSKSKKRGAGRNPSNLKRRR